MSSLLELIARRRRASASRRLGPPQNADEPARRTLAPTAGAVEEHGSTAARPVDNGNGRATMNGSGNGNGHALNGLVPALTVQLPALPSSATALSEPPATEEGPNTEEAPDTEDSLEAPPADEPPALEPAEDDPADEEAAWEVVPTEDEPSAGEPAVAEPEAAEPAVAEPQAAEPATDDQLTVELPVTERPQPVAVPGAPRYLTWLPSPEPLRRDRTLVAVPAGAAARPHLHERAQMRRRLRYLRHLRELQLRDIGGFELELHRFGRERSEIVRAKIESAARTDEELRSLERALEGRVPLREVREPGIGGVCGRCGAVHGSEDRFCASCGHEIRNR